MGSYLIYGLIDPRNGQLRYVGKSCSGMKRPAGHTEPSRLLRERTHKAMWLRQLLGAGLRPDIQVLESSASADELNEAEQFHIAYWRFVGADLTNLTDGGEGSVGHKQTPEHTEKIAKSNRGRIHTSQTRARMSAVKLGIKKSPKHVINISRSHGGRSFRDQTGAVYGTLQEASSALGCHKANIWAVLQGKRRSTGGFTFSYV